MAVLTLCVFVLAVLGICCIVALGLAHFRPHSAFLIGAVVVSSCAYLYMIFMTCVLLFFVPHAKPELYSLPHRTIFGLAMPPILVLGTAVSAAGAGIRVIARVTQWLRRRTRWRKKQISG